jgi:CubicO group peptidase (beta-lactamase class C family)
MHITDTVNVGCVAKALTATLVAIAQHQGKLSLNSSLASFFPELNSPEATASPDIGHLLNHTHGLDHSPLQALPRDERGYIDINSMSAVLRATQPIAQPGEVFSYGNLGPWLAAVILERVYDESYAAILQKLLFRPLNIPALESLASGQVCPGMGGKLRLSAEDLMKLALLHLRGDLDGVSVQDELCDLRRQYCFPLPDATLAGRCVFPGWFDFGGSFGQFGYGEDSAAVVRFLPDEDIAIVVTARHKSLANSTMVRLFKDLLPDYSRVRPPQLLTPAEWSERDSHCYLGTFDNGGYRLRVDVAKNGSLRAKLFRKFADLREFDEEPYVKRYFKAATNHSFFPTEPEPMVCPELRFSHPGSDSRFRYVNTGKFVFARVAE